MDPLQLDFRSNTLAETLDMEFKTLTKECVVITMPVNEKTHQPAGLLHGGASLALAETAASMGGYLNVNRASQAVVGVEINANHVRSKRAGTVTATAVPLHIGRKTMVWEIRICDEDDKLVCISRCTLAVIELEEAHS